MKTENEDRVTSVLVVGVGGQGVILASDVLAEVAGRSGLDVKKSEVHGMAQRGGSVNAHVRFGEKVYSPLIPMGEAGIVLSFEQMESLNYVENTSAKALFIIDKTQLPPTTVNFGEIPYPDDPVESLRRHRRVIDVDGIGVAAELGNPRMANTVLLGVLSVHLDIEEGLWKDVISENVPPRTVEANVRAFGMGREIGDSIR